MQKLRLGIIGTGSVVREIYEYLYFHSAYSAMIDIVAVCDVNRAAAQSFIRRNALPDTVLFADYHAMFEQAELDAVAVNTPDHLHTAPVLAALERGFDILLPKPTAESTADVHAILTRLAETERFMGVDFHKRENPQVKEARARVRNGEYGRLQSGVMYMIDKLLVADPNHSPRFFATPDFAEKNSPVSFLTSHMADTFVHITGLRPVTVRATGYSQKLPTLTPIAVNGYDLVDTEVLFDSGALCHIMTGWALPNTAHAVTTQSVKMVFTDGMLELRSDDMGYSEITAEGIKKRNILFRNFEENDRVTGFGMDCPGKILDDIRRYRAGEMTAAEKTRKLSPESLGFYTTLICECAARSLEDGGGLHGMESDETGVVRGPEIDVRAHLESVLGRETAQQYL